MEDLKTIIGQLEQMLADGQIAPILKKLKELLPDKSPKKDALILLEKRQNDANLQRIKDTLSDEQLQNKYNQISSDLLDLIQSLEDSDFDEEQAVSQISEDKTVKQGSILYKVPGHMVVEEEAECIIRVAFDEAQIIEGLDLSEDVKVTDSRISNIMQAKLQDPSGGENFKIVAANDDEQFVDEDSYTEWLFQVTPLSPGEHQLWLKVAIIETYKGKERKREIVLKEQIKVVATPAEEPAQEAKYKRLEEASFSLRGLVAAAGTPIVPGPKEKADGGEAGGNASVPRRLTKGFNRVATMVVGLLAVTAAVFAFTSSQQRSWVLARYLIDTPEALERYADRYQDPFTPNRESALFLAAQKSNSIPHMLRYLDEYGLEPIDSLSGYELKFPRKETTIVSSDQQAHNRIILTALAQLEPELNQEILASEKKELIRQYLSWIPPDRQDPEIQLLASRLLPEVYAKADTVPRGIPGSFMNADPVVTAPEMEQPEQPVLSDPGRNPEPILSYSSMILVSGGTFQMGCTREQEGACLEVERPVHAVTLADYLISQYEVTFAEYNAYCNEDPNCYLPSDDGMGKGSRPVINVSWYDALKYCNWLSEKEGLEPVYTIRRNEATADWEANGYRLPTEAEWEYAARSRGKAQKWVGTSSIDSLFLFANLSSTSIQSETALVGSLMPNALGINDMGGNVWEWCWDQWQDRYPSDQAQQNPKGPESGTNRVVRGGSWLTSERLSRVSSRWGEDPMERLSDHGFRLARNKE